MCFWIIVGRSFIKRRFIKSVAPTLGNELLFGFITSDSSYVLRVLGQE